jgi:hypothetical protein
MKKARRIISETNQRVNRRKNNPSTNQLNQREDTSSSSNGTAAMEMKAGRTRWIAVCRRDMGTLTFACICMCAWVYVVGNRGGGS